MEILPGGVIRFNRVTGEEGGEYRCTAEKMAGRAETVATLTINQVPEITLTHPGLCDYLYRLTADTEM